MRTHVSLITPIPAGAAEWVFLDSQCSNLQPKPLGCFSPSLMVSGETTNNLQSINKVKPKNEKEKPVDSSFQGYGPIFFQRALGISQHTPEFTGALVYISLFSSFLLGESAPMFCESRGSAGCQPSLQGWRTLQPVPFPGWSSSEQSFLLLTPLVLA